MPLQFCIIQHAGHYPDHTSLLSFLGKCVPQIISLLSIMSWIKIYSIPKCSASGVSPSQVFMNTEKPFDMEEGRAEYRRKFGERRTENNILKIL